MARRRKSSLGIKYSVLSLEMLENLLDETKKEIRARRVRIAREEARRKLYEFDELSTEKAVSESLEQENLPKKHFVHPLDEKLIWNGRGKEPSWLKELVDSGYKRDSLVVYI